MGLPIPEQNIPAPVSLGPEPSSVIRTLESLKVCRPRGGEPNRCPIPLQTRIRVQRGKETCPQGRCPDRARVEPETSVPLGRLYTPAFIFVPWCWCGTYYMHRLF